MSYEWAVISTFVAWNPLSYLQESEVPCYVTPESVMLRREAYQLLSDEAKELISLVLNAPSEIVFDCGKPSIMRIYDILRSREWTWSKINKARSEVIQYVRTL
jgi:hypothetical protein